MLSKLQIVQLRRLFFLTSSLSYSASGEGGWGWAASVSKESASASVSRFGLGSESESRSGWDDPWPVEVFFPFGTTSCFRIEAMIKIALTLKQIQPSDTSDYFLFLQASISRLLFVCSHNLSARHTHEGGGWGAGGIFLQLQFMALKSLKSTHCTLSVRIVCTQG